MTTRRPRWSPRAVAARALKRLPPPRDGAAVDLIRAATTVLTGRQAPRAGSPGGGAVAYSHTGIDSHRWMRSAPTGDDAPPPDGHVALEVSDPARAAAVRAGWQLVGAYERLSTAGADLVFGPQIDTWKRHAEKTMAPPLSPDGKPFRWVGNDRLRFRRISDVVLPGDRVFDIGAGGGYLASVLARDRRIAGYSGIELKTHKAELASRVLAAQGLDTSSYRVHQGDLYDLTAEQVSAAGAELLICCEVLEHVPDAAKALRVLADALPEGADVLFSVPLHGRLEHVWGHRSVFDVNRLHTMLAGASLYVHHVEPVANTWTLVLASRSSAPSRRVPDASERPVHLAVAPMSKHHDFVDVRSAHFTGKPIGQQPGSDPLMTVTGSYQVAVTMGQPGGVSFPVDGLEALRLRFGLQHPGDLHRVEITLHRGSKKVGGWDWSPSKHNPRTNLRISLRPGEWGAGVTAQPLTRSSTDATAVLVSAASAPGRVGRFTLSAAYLP
ncbi:MAG: class I SAM-dependent methyltransferase [Angustibacter sp.]